MPDKDLVQVLDIFNPSFLKNIFDETAGFLGSLIGQTLSSYWSRSKLSVILVILLFFVVKFGENGIGSLIYNIIYFSILGFVILFGGWKIIFNDWFEIMVLLAYIISFKLTRFLLVRAGVWN